jgi:serine/threonine protein kinase
MSSSKISDNDSNDNLSSDDYDFSKNGKHLYYHVIKNKYMLLKKIGFGSFSSVWFVLDWQTTKFYAMKIYNDSDYEEGINEIKILKTIKKTNCKYLMNMHDYFIYETNFNNEKYRHPCIVLELMVGSLYELGKYEFKKNGIPINIIEKIIPQLIEGINVLHNNLKIIHGDLKPENILIKGYCVEIETFISYILKLDLKKIYNNFKSLTKVCEYIGNLLYDVSIDETKFIDQKFLDNIEICIIDFGSIIHKSNFSTDEIMTRYYRGPEILLGLKHNFGSDIWALGCVLYELITGKILFDPNKDELRCRDYNHLLLIHKYLGKISPHLISNSPYKRNFYNRYRLKHDNIIEYYDIITIDLKQKIIDNNFSDKYIKIIKNMLNFESNKRLLTINSTI